MKTSATIILSGLLFTGGCAGAGAPPIPAPADPAGQSAAVILNECRSDDPDRQLACHEAAVLEVLDREGVAAAMAVAERMGDLDPEVRRHGHVYAHAIGLAAYTTPEAVGRIFGSCTAAYQSGCYHGVIQSYFVDVADEGGVDADAINALCAGQRGPAGNSWLLFQCAHGIGHGVTMLSGHHLPRSLQACDLIIDEWEREACYGGVFMENVVQATLPHHSVGRPQHEAAGAEEHAGADEHAGHHQHGDPAVSAGGDADHFPPLDAADPLYPCNVLEERYLRSCYQMQTSAIMFFNGSDVAATAAVCETAPERHRPGCYQSLGRDVSALTVQEHARALELCELAGAGRYDCHRGYVKNVVDVTAQPADGFEFCDVVPDDEGRRRCFQAVGEQVWVLAGDAARREEICAGVQPSYVESCRRGAGLVTAPAAADRPVGAPPTP